MWAPVTGLAVASLSFRVTVTGPTRAGCGSTSELITMGDVEESRFEHPAHIKQSARKVKRHPRRKCIRPGWRLSMIAKRFLGSLRSRQFFVMPFASAVRLGFSWYRKHVIVHSDHHRYEHNRIVEEVEFHA